jgi:hypothetical protein
MLRVVGSYTSILDFQTDCVNALKSSPTLSLPALSHVNLHKMEPWLSSRTRQAILSDGVRSMEVQSMGSSDDISKTGLKLGNAWTRRRLVINDDPATLHELKQAIPCMAHPRRTSRVWVLPALGNQRWADFAVRLKRCW